MALLERGLEDVSFSRPKSKVAWGVPVPGDEDQVMYVWCDALSNYITALGYGTDTFDVERWKDATHVIGKDILRFHAAIWPGMLLSAGLALPKKILVHGHITSGGQKMSKSLGNVIDPREAIEMFRPVAGELAGEALRFVLLHEVPSFEDGDLTIDSIKTAYTAHLANGIGNLTNRIMKMALSYGVDLTEEDKNMIAYGNNIKNEFLEKCDIAKSVNELWSSVNIVNGKWSSVTSLDEDIQTSEPFKKIKVNIEEAKKDVYRELYHLLGIALLLEPFMPKTSAKIIECIREHKMPETPLFRRL